MRGGWGSAAGGGRLRRRIGSEGARFAREEGGAAAVIFAIVFSAIFVVTAMAIDYGIGSTEKLRQQAALDAAAMAASEKLGLPDQDSAGPAAAVAMYNANTRYETRGQLEPVRLDSETGEVRALGMGDVGTALMRVVGINSLKIGTASRVIRGTGSVEVALVLDNSGSMTGQPIVDLRTAAKNLVSVVTVGAVNNDRVRVGVVPFAASVNVGAASAAAGWIDTAGISPAHYENLEPPAGGQAYTRFTMLQRMGVAWGGCVETRPAPHDFADTAPSAANPATLFVPMFAPDEPDSVNAAGKSYLNSYMSDFGGTCPPAEQVCTSWSRRGNCQAWSTTPIDTTLAQKRVCKYDGGTADTSLAYGTQKGPNLLCDTQPVLPLTSTKSQIDGAIDAMIAKGGTNIAEGVAWGWRVLSPDPPYTEGRPYTDTDNKKFLVLMTDGENWHGGQDNINLSWYHSFGYAAANRLGLSSIPSTASARTTALKQTMNEKTTAVCASAKAAGITVYTVAFRLETNPTTLAILSACASASDKAFRASDGAGLIAAFKQIGRDISNLRVAG
jgi:Flp pilus assembly protein TadG